MNFDKKNYAIKVYKDENCDKKLKTSFLDWDKSNNYVLKANWIDSTQARNTVCAQLFESLPNSATKGIISGIDVRIGDSYYPLLQTDAAINPGNSGGPLIDLTGAVVGINSSKYAATSIEGMAFSIPVETINYVLNQFEKNGAVLRPDIAAAFDESWESRIGLPTTN